MRKTSISVASLCLLVVALAAPLSAQGGGKKKHPVDSSQTVTSDQTLKGDHTFKGDPALNSPFAVKSDLTLKSGVSASTGETAAEETFSNGHVARWNTGGPIYLKWEFDDKRGYAELVFAGDGEWALVGDYDNKKPGTAFEVVMALKDKSGTVFIFHLAGSVKKGKHKWGGGSSGANGLGAFNTLAAGFDVRGAYRLPPKAGVKTETNAETPVGRCETTSATAPGWGPIWSWVDPQHRCWQFNTGNDGERLGW